MGKTAARVVEQARSWLGCKESDGSHKKIIDVYNSHKPLPRGYRVKDTDPWCAAFVSAVAIRLGYTDIIPAECSCAKMIEQFRRLGAWAEDESRTPRPGDILFYDWEDDGKGDNTGRADHVGIVEKVSGGTVTVIEGNLSNGVNRRKLAVNGRYIRGYGMPKYDVQTCAPALQVLEKGCKGAPVKAMQLLLIGWGFDCGSKGADGSFGAATDSALRSYQTAGGIGADGICGSKTWAKLLGAG